MTLALLIVIGALVAVALAVVRLVRGPGQADRIVALDVVFSATIALTAAAALATGRALFLDIGVGLSLVGFVATIVWARLIDASAERGGSGEGGEEGR
jgi:multicomponent Na+:H+ antiporter subunit F